MAQPDTVLAGMLVATVSFAGACSTNATPPAGAAGGSFDSASDPQPIAVVSAERTASGPFQASGWAEEFGFPAEADLLLTLDVLPGLYLRSCSNATRFAKASGEPWRNDTPAPGTGAYYLGSEYMPNEMVSGPWCDLMVCTPFPESLVFNTWDIVETGRRTPPADLAGTAGAAGATGATPDPTGGEGGVAEPAGELVPVVEPVYVEGPFTFTATYYTDPACESEPHVTGPLLVDIE